METKWFVLKMSLRLDHGRICLALRAEEKNGFLAFIFTEDNLLREDCFWDFEKEFKNNFFLSCNTKEEVKAGVEAVLKHLRKLDRFYDKQMKDMESVLDYYTGKQKP